jgi:phosphoglycerate dehydrogenase-like enzyme
VTARDLDVGKGPTGEDGWTGASRIPSLPLHQSVLGIAGYGRIGKKVAELARLFFASILVCDPYLDQEVFSEAGVRSVDLDQLLGTADVVTLHVPLFRQPQRVYAGFEADYRPTEQFYRPTVGMIGEEQIAGMKDGALLVNTSRGGMIRESAVVDALIRGKLGGVGLDVFEEEPLSRAHPLRKMADADLPENHPLREAGQEKYNITLTFHSAYYLRGVFTTVETLTAEEIVLVLVHKQLPHHLVNPAVL